MNLCGTSLNSGLQLLLLHLIYILLDKCPIINIKFKVTITKSMVVIFELLIFKQMKNKHNNLK